MVAFEYSIALKSASTHCLLMIENGLVRVKLL